MILVFIILAAVLLLSGLGVVLMRNPIHSALCLILNMLVIAGLFAMLDAHFLATAQIVVYAGAVMVLVVFVIMLLNLKVEAAGTGTVAYAVLGGVAAVLFLAVLAPILLDTFSVFDKTQPVVIGSVKAMGKELYTRFLFPFELASILIVAAIVGAVMLAKNRGAK